MPPELPLRLAPLAAGLKCQVGADSMGPIADQEAKRMGVEALRSLRDDGGVGTQSFPAHTNTHEASIKQ